MGVRSTDFETERSYADERFSTVEVARTDRMKAVLGYFEPGQFIPVHAPASDVTIHVRSGTGIVHAGGEEHAVEPGDVVVVEADSDRGIKAEVDSRLEALLVTAPPPTEEEHEPVRRGLANDDFYPDGP